MSLSSAGNNPRSANSDVPRFEVFVPAQAGPPPTNGRLGVLGGAYNPITRAHLLLARYSKKLANLDQVFFVLSRVLPNKPRLEVSVEQRLEMMRLGSSGIPYISLGVCSHGLFLDICIALQQIYPQKPEIFFITGRDAAERILTWPYDDPAAALAKMFADFQLLVFERQGKFQLPGDTLVQKYRNRIRTLEIEENLDTISSTVVRKRVSEGRSITELVPVEVAAFIQEHSLYRDFAEE
ncbi:MAG: nicotinate-nicotinamide nucleotide adenylyltransferase [Deltaproteobacteria bacterium]|nr:nicotinate-nicotinamide nucleotide adenylyltransferase [Deltaproteobacteria bacterium]